MTISSDLLCSFELLPPAEQVVSLEKKQKKNRFVLLFTLLKIDDLSPFLFYSLALQLPS